MSEPNVKFKEFQIPQTFFDKLYEFTGGGESTRGFVLFYISNGDQPIIRSAFRNSVVELALMKTISDFAKSQQTQFGGGEEDSDTE